MVTLFMFLVVSIIVSTLIIGSIYFVYKVLIKPYYIIAEVFYSNSDFILIDKSTLKVFKVYDSNVDLLKKTEYYEAFNFKTFLLFLLYHVSPDEFWDNLNNHLIKLNP